MTKQNLSEGSKSYHSEAHIYERFSQLEDTPKKIMKILVPLVKGKTVLDLGCGTGKYLIQLAPLSKKYYGLDISKDQLKIAKKKSKGIKNVKFICSSAEKIDLPDESVDVIISTWVLGTILDEKRRLKAISEAKRVLKKDGKTYLVENDIGGDFERIRGRYPDTARTQKYNKWLKSQGFKPIKKFTTYFKCSRLDEARSIFGAIWGNRATKKIHDEKISHKIVIFMYNN